MRFPFARFHKTFQNYYLLQALKSDESAHRYNDIISTSFSTVSNVQTN